MKALLKSLRSKMPGNSNTKTRKMKITITYQVEYEASEDLYENPDPKEMAKVDEEAAASAPFIALQGMIKLPGGRFKVKVEPVLTNADKAGLEIEQ